MFARIVGQDRPLTILRQALRTQRVAQAYLFSGPERVGKTTTAVALAQALNCLTPERAAEPPDACGQCRSCRKIESGNHPDVRVIEPRLGSRSEGSTTAGRPVIGIQRLREEEKLYTEVHLRPSEGRFKVYVFAPAESLTAEAANSLLKILEEPPPRVIWVLTTSNLSALLPTVRSRCQLVSFGLAPTEVVRAYLFQRGTASPEQVELSARLAAGRVGRGVELAADRQLLARRERVRALVERVLQAPPVGSLAAAEEVMALAQATDGEGQDPTASSPSGLAHFEEVFELLSFWLRDLLVWRQTGQASALINADLKDSLAAQAAARPAAHWLRLIRALQRTRRQLQRNANAQLALEVFMLQFWLAGN